MEINEIKSIFSGNKYFIYKNFIWSNGKWRVSYNLKGKGHRVLIRDMNEVSKECILFISKNKKQILKQYKPKETLRNILGIESFGGLFF